MQQLWFGLQSRSVSEAGSTYALLDGTSDKNISVSSETFNFSGTTDDPFSIIAWGDGTGLSNGEQLVLFGRSNTTESPYALRILKESGLLYLEFSVYAASRTTKILIKTGIGEGWHQWAVTYSGNRNASGVDLYMDGVGIPYTTITNDLTAMYTGVVGNQIGQYMSTNGKGKVKDVAVFSIKLTANQITEAYNNRVFKDYRSSSFSANCLAYWSLNNTLGALIGGPTLNATTVDYVDVVSENTAYVRSTGNNGTAELNDNTKPYLTIDAALIALKAGNAKSNVVDIQESASFAAPSQANCIDNTWFKGNAQSVVNSSTNPTGLTTGTIIQGNFKPRNSNFKATDFGVDAGKTWIDANNGGTALDAFSAAGYTNGTDGNYIGYTVGVYLKNITALSYSAASLTHAVLLEHSVNPYFENIKGYYGVHGLVYKTFGGLGVNIEAYGNNLDGLIIKSDSFNTNTRNVTINGFKYRNINGSNPVSAQVFIQSQFESQGDPIENVLITNADLDDWTAQTGFVSVTGSTSNISITDANGHTFDVMRRKLKSYWKLNETSGNRSDSSIGGYTLTDVNSVPSATGIIGNGADITVNNKKLTNTTAGVFNGTLNAFTINYWVKFNSTPTNGDNIIGRPFTFVMYWNAGKINTAHSFDGVNYTFGAPNPTLSTGTWYMVTVTGNSGGIFYRVNNGSATNLGAMNTSLGVDGAQSWFIGGGALATFDEVSLFDRALSSTEIATLYNSGSAFEIPLS